MRKTFLLSSMALLFLSLSAIGQISFESRHSNQTGFYCRIHLEKDLSKKFGLTAGYNVDGRSIIHLEASYEVFTGVKFVAGTGYHHYQDGFHPSIGILVYKDIFDVELEGHVRMLFNHLYHLGSEFKLVKKFDNKWETGIATEIEIGKEFMPLKEAREVYIKNEPEYETIALIGSTVGYKINDNFSVNCFVICGLQNQQNKNTFSYKSSVGLTYMFPEKHH